MCQVIIDDDYLLRRIRFTDPNHVRPDGSPTSLAFKLRKKDGTQEDGLSVDIERLTSYRQSINDVRSFRLFSLRVEEVRQLGLNCVYAPDFDSKNLAHSLIIGQFSDNICRKLARTASRINYPD